MTVRVEQIAEERVIHGDADALLEVTGRVRHIGHAYHGVHVHPGGTLITSGIIDNWLRIDAGGSLYSTGAISTPPIVAEGGLLDIRGTLYVPRLPREIPGTILLAVGARYNNLVLHPNGTLAPRIGIEGGNASETAPRFSIINGGFELVLMAESMMDRDAHSARTCSQPVSPHNINVG